MYGTACQFLFLRYGMPPRTSVRRPPIGKDIGEQELITLLQRRDRDAFALLYDRYAAALYGAILRVVHQEALAEDVLQETFVKVWGACESYSPAKGKLFTWLIAIARNAALDLVKSKGYNNAAKNDSLEDVAHVVDHQTGQSRNMDTVGLVEIVETLKPEHQELIDLIYFQGYTQLETAQTLCLPLGTVKTRLRAAVMALRTIYMKAEVPLLETQDTGKASHWRSLFRKRDFTPAIAAVLMQ